MLLTRTTMIPTKYGFDKYDSMKYLFSTWKNGKIQEESTKILCLLFKQGTIPYALQYQVLLSLEQLQFTNMTLLPIARSVMPQFPHTGGWTIAGKGHDNKQVHICAKVLSLTVWCQVSTEGLVWLWLSPQPSSHACHCNYFANVLRVGRLGFLLVSNSLTPLVKYLCSMMAWQFGDGKPMGWTTSLALNLSHNGLAWPRWNCMACAQSEYDLSDWSLLTLHTDFCVCVQNNQLEHHVKKTTTSWQFYDVYEDLYAYKHYSGHVQSKFLKSKIKYQRYYKSPWDALHMNYSLDLPPVQSRPIFIIRDCSCIPANSWSSEMASKQIIAPWVNKVSFQD